MNEQEKFKFSKVEDLLKTMKAVFDQLGIPSNQTIKRINADDLFKGFSFISYIDECECQLVNPDLWAIGDNIIIAERLLERFGKMKDSAERYDRIIHQPRLPERTKTGKTVDGMKPLTAREVVGRTLLIALGSQLEQASKVLGKAMGPRCACGWDHDAALTRWKAEGIGPFSIRTGTHLHKVLIALHEEAQKPFAKSKRLKTRDWLDANGIDHQLSEIANKKQEAYKALVSTVGGYMRLKTPDEGKADLAEPKKIRRSKKV